VTLPLPPEQTPRMLRLRLWLARWLVAPWGFSVVRATPLGLLPSRLEAVAQRIRTSGHLAHRYHVRRTLERDLSALTSQVEHLVGGVSERRHDS
jgi:hypothetical protein